MSEYVEVFGGKAPRNAALMVVPRSQASGWACQECGHKFRTLKGAEKAAFGPSGCPKCGGSDVDLTVST